MPYKYVISLFFLSLLGCTQQGPEQADKDQPIAPETVSVDQREILLLNDLQRDFVLQEMRQLLIATQGVLEGIANDDMMAVQKAAQAVGANAQHTVENRENMQRLKMGAVLPGPFRSLGMNVHQSFDEIAQMAKDGASAKDIELKLATTMSSCIACHQTYQIGRAQ